MRAAVSVPVDVGVVSGDAGAVEELGDGRVDGSALIIASRGLVAPEHPTTENVVVPTTTTATTNAMPRRRTRGSAEGKARATAASLTRKC